MAAAAVSLRSRKRLIASRRKRLGEWIERAIALLDLLDGDADLEPVDLLEGDELDTREVCELDTGECGGEEYGELDEAEQAEMAPCSWLVPARFDVTEAEAREEREAAQLARVSLAGPRRLSRTVTIPELSLSRSRHPAACPINGS
jgi:hypothetical protein